ncbi:MAG: hydantoinase/oxoprolinase family protein, partial [Castellaniella sp.]|uniref:hydantoinase/oxoprolinase family protein n=1 Tax=Castellaniella sp. TaxID=1955812 RepID=UPI002A3655C7
RDQGAVTPVRYYQSNGGMASLEVMASRAVNAINSGPASAPQAAMHIGKPFGYDNLITVDMGGTSFDMTLTHGGVTNVSKDIDFLRYRIGTPMVQVETLGAGGGSIAWIDGMGVLNVGPGSAGADPGPAAYGRGGTEPTVTDSNVVLGYLNPEYLLGGRLKIDRQAAYDAIDRNIAQPLGISPERAAYGIHSIVNHNMVAGIRRVTIERGHDPRDFVLVGAGGATSLHIAALAREIGIRTVLIPKLASGLCAFGQILSDIKYNLMAACPMRLDAHADLTRIEQRFQELQDQALALLEKEEGIRSAQVSFERSIDMRYVGQIHECTVNIGSLTIGDDTIGDIRRAFDAMHEQLFTYSEPESEVEIVNIESIALLRSDREIQQQTPPGGRLAEALLTHRPMIFNADGSYTDTPVYDGNKLGEGDELTGPAIIEETTTTIVIDPGWHIRLDAGNTYIMRDQQTA